MIGDVSYSRDSQQPDPLTLEEWTSALKLSTMWQFYKIRAAAIKAMQNLSMEPVDQIVIARRFDISAWLVPALSALVQRETLVDVSEGNRLGMEWVLKLAEVREGLGTRPSKVYICQGCNHRGPARCTSCTSTTTINRCSSCTSTTFNRCSSCNTTISPAAASNSDCSEQIRKVFELA
jgi:hypothetical protein